MSIIKTVLKLAAALLSGSLVKRLLDSIGYPLGLDLGGLTSLIAMAVMAFLTMFLLFPRNYLKDGVKRVFRRLFSFLLIWLMATLFSAFFHVKYYTQIGFIAGFLYILFIREPPNAKIRLRIVCREEPAQPEDHTILLSLAPVPKVAFLHGFSLRGLLKVLRGKARLHLKLPEDAFMESFEHRQTLKLKASLSSFTEAVGKSLTGDTAILCEAKPGKELMKVEAASDNPQALEEFKRILREASPGSVQGIRQALEEWFSMKPYVMPVPELLDLNPSRLAGRLLIVGERRNAENLALQLCLSQLRRNSMALVVDVKGKPEDAGDEIKRRLVEKGFKPSKNRLRKKPVKTYRHHNGMEVVFAGELSDEVLLKKTLSKPLTAVWFRGLARNLDVDAPIKILTLKKPWARSSFEADNVILVNCEKELIETFLPSRGVALEGRTVLISQQGVRVLK